MRTGLNTKRKLPKPSTPVPSAGPNITSASPRQAHTTGIRLMRTSIANLGHYLPATNRQSARPPTSTVLLCSIRMPARAEKSMASQLNWCLPLRHSKDLVKPGVNLPSVLDGTEPKKRSLLEGRVKSKAQFPATLHCLRRQNQYPSKFGQPPEKWKSYWDPARGSCPTLPAA